MDVSRHLDRDPTISPTKAPIVLPTSTPSISPSISSQPSSMPSFSPISISYQYSVSYPNDRKPDNIHFALSSFTNDVVAGAIDCTRRQSSFTCPGGNIEFEFDGIREPECGYYDFSVDVQQLILISSSLVISLLATTKLMSRGLHFQ